MFEHEALRQALLEINDLRTREAAALREAGVAHARMIAALSGASEGFLMLDAAGAIVFANAPWRAFFPAGGRGWAEGRAFVDVWRDRLGSLGVSRAAALRAASQRLTAMRDGRMESEERLDDGRIVLLSERSIGDGQCLSIATDITGLKASERDLALRTAAMDEAQDGIALADEAGHVVYLNAAFLDLFGFSDETEALGLHWSALCTAEAAAAHQRPSSADLEQSGAWRGQAVGRHTDGSAIEQDVALTLIRGVGMIATARDPLPRRQAEAEHSSLRAQLNAAQRQKALGVVAAGIAHDFNNILAVISGTATLLAAATTPATTDEAHLKRILEAADRAALLVGRLLDFGKRRSAPALTAIGTVLSDAAVLIEASAGDVSLAITIPSDDVDVCIDPTDLMQVLLNLVINARDASRPGHGSISVTVDPDANLVDLADPVVGLLAADRRYAAISVTDNGTGIAGHCLTTIFEPYVSTKGMDGTGLGLAVVAGIVTAADGAVCVQSAPGKTTFTVLLPRADGDALARTIDRFDPLAEPAGLWRTISTPRKTASAAVGGGGDLDGLLILVVDDEPDTARLAAAALQAAGAQMTVCSRVADALLAIRLDPSSWDVIVADARMPGMDGDGLAATVGELAADAPLLLLDGSLARIAPCGPSGAVIREPFSAAAFNAAAFIAAVRGALSERARLIDGSRLADSTVTDPPGSTADSGAAVPPGLAGERTAGPPGPRAETVSRSPVARPADSAAANPRAPAADNAAAGRPGRHADGVAASTPDVRRCLAIASPAYPAVLALSPAKIPAAGGNASGRPIRGALG